MKKTLLFLFLGLQTLTHAQIINIPDANFKNALLNNPCVDTNGDSWGDADADLNNDGEIQVNEALSVNALHINDLQITTLSGIEHFENLQQLYCVANDLTQLDLQSLTHLKEFYGRDNQLTALNVQGLSDLQVLDCRNNALTELNVQGLPGLQVLHCGENALTELNVQGLLNLTILACERNQITSLNVQELANLEQFVCSENALSTLDVHGLSQMTNFQCDDNQLTTMNTLELVSLQILMCRNNLLTSLDVSNSPLLHTLLCNSNHFTTMLLKNGSMELNGLNFSNNPFLEYICCDEAQLGNIQQKVNQFGLVNCVVNTYCNFAPGGIHYTLQGNNKFDFNQNGCDAGDSNTPNLKLQITDGTISATLIANTSGDYKVLVPAGTYVVTPAPENPAYFTFSPDQIQLTFPGSNSPVVQDFCITPVGVHSDLEITVIPLLPARPGFDASYHLIYKNKGNQWSNGSLSFGFDDNLLDFVSADQSPNSQNAGVLTWNYTNLAPFESRTIALVLNCNSPMEVPPVNGGMVLDFEAQIAGDNDEERPEDNIFNLQQIVVNAFDPNDKTCLEGQTITPAMVGDYVHYLIRFENTGTYPAENIVVKDVIDTNVFELASLQVVDASHDLYTRIVRGNEVEFIFENIQLPFDPDNNDGYVAFKIKTLPTLVLGNRLRNKAAIYFDYNFPIITNQTETIVQNPTVSTETISIPEIAVFPNPVSEMLYFEFEQAISTLDLFDVSGTRLLSVVPTGNKLDVKDLPAGTYVVKIQVGNDIYRARMIKI